MGCSKRYVFLSCVVLAVESKVDFAELNDEENLKSEAYSAQLWRSNQLFLMGR